MASWTELQSELQHQDPGFRDQWLNERLLAALGRIRALRGDRNVLFYASAFLQKPLANGMLTQIMPEDINGYMSCVVGMDWSKGLTLILHTPGGVTTAAETVVQYLCSKFSDVEVIVPTFAMSAGTMISLAADRIVMGRHSQLGPIDTQMVIGGKPVSAQAIVDQFELAKKEISADVKMAHLWAPILASLGPALIKEAQNALDYGETMVGLWLAQRMFKGLPDPIEKGKAVAKHFNAADNHKSHGRRIGRDEARAQGVEVEDLEDSQALQEAVLTAYHLLTLLFEQTTCAKAICSDHGQRWTKHVQPVGAPVVGRT